MTNMLKSALLAAAAATAFVALPAMADVLTFDADALFANSAAGKSGSQQMQAKYGPLLQQRETQLRADAQSYNTQVEAIKKAAKPGTQPQPTPALQQLVQKIQQEQSEIQQVQDEANQIGGYVRSQIIEKARPIAEQIRAERKANAVIDKNGTLAADPASDITTTLVQRLDASFTTPTIVPPQQPGATAAPGAAGGKTQGR